MTDEAHDPQTGEIIDARPIERAADGGRIPHAATTAGEFINMIEDGQFSADLNNALSDLAAMMTDLVHATSNKQTGKVTITLDFATEGGPFHLAGSFKVTPPKEKRRKTLVWTDEHNRFTRTQPRQGTFFGVRDVSGAASTRSI